MNTPLAIENLDRCWTSLDDLLSGLTDDQATVPSLCPGWTVRDVVLHIGGIEHMLRGEAPGAFADSLPFDRVGAWISSFDGASNAELLAGFRDVIAARRHDLASLTDADLETPTLTPVGRGTYGRFMAVRVFDCWVHEQDIRVPLGIRGHEDGPAAEMAIAEIDGSLGYIIGKKVGLPDGMSITIELTGPIERAFHVAVTGRATRVDELDEPDVVLRTVSTTFALLACGRIDPQGPIDDGRITWSGDDQWGETAARNLAFTM
jgi:uncharacterized protein (TIGR03083 family)